MAYVVKDRVKVTSTTTGTGTFTLGAAEVGFQDFTAISSPTDAWNISKAFYSGINFSVGGQDTVPTGLFFKPDGTKMYMLGSTGDDVNEYNLSTPWVVSSALFVQTKSVSLQETAPQGLFFKPDGTKMYVTGTSSDAVNEYDLSSAWNISTATYLQNFSVAGEEINPNGVFFKPDGTKMYVVGTTGDDVNEYDLGTAWNVSTASYVQNFSVAAQETTPSDLSFEPDGTNMYVIGSGSDNVNQYNLSVPWDISSASYLQAFSVSGQESTPVGLFFGNNGFAFYILGSVTDTVYQYTMPGSFNQTYYTITNGTDWEIGIGIVNEEGTELDRDTVLESSNSDALVDFPAGTKTVFVTFPSENTEGTVPTADNSSVGTDLVAWLNLKKQLDAGVVNGVPYANNGTNGIVSTYSLVYTTVNAYYGGVLAPNGDIHFVPSQANRGQKINSSGVVSTYSLVYTTATGAYFGGVLAPNGDIHFVPNQANRGQKISASGVVSTYSLVYTTADAYTGGVLASNGDIHFIPLQAKVGQKISAAGVGSTYSLVYTATFAYSGGVLAPNGDIHFVPDRAVRGQKVSASGVVSTYSLVYTTAGNAYKGGVLAPNGDIHFVPHVAIVGQKISAAGVVSTYSLVYTATGAFQGGVLAPNGDIHFVPFNSIVGQKVSATGVVSTYSLLYAGILDGTYAGGVLSTNGDIYFVPFANGAALGQKISTNVQQKVGYALSPFFNKF
jgi:hypothetical protein